MKYSIKIMIDSIKIGKEYVITNLFRNNILRFNIWIEQSITIVRTNLLINLADSLVILSIFISYKY